MYVCISVFFQNGYGISNIYAEVWFMQVILEFLWLLLSFIIHLEAWKAEGREYRLLAMEFNIQKNQLKAEEKRQKLQQMRSFMKALFFNININYLMTVSLSVCMSLYIHTWLHTERI